MPTERPNNVAGEDIPTDARDDRTAAAVLGDDAPDALPGGGAMGSAAAASGTSRASGGPAPNAPLADAAIAGDTDAAAEHKARTRMAGDATATERTAP